MSDLILASACDEGALLQGVHTFYVICLAMVVLVGFETAFFYLRRFLVIHLASRLDVKLSTYVFDKILNLPIDFFERIQSVSFCNASSIFDGSEIFSLGNFLEECWIVQRYCSSCQLCSS